MLAAAAIAAGTKPAAAQPPQAPPIPQTPQPTPIPEEAAAAALKNDSDPTRPVLFSIRPEFYHPTSKVTQAAQIFRYDQAALRARRFLPGKRGVILRFELPITETHVDDVPGQAGLGDAYGQILVAPYLTRKRAFVIGTGLLIPTATDNLLGAGKWVMAPAVAPVWFFAGRGMFLVKVQDFKSIAGDSERPSINFLLITPTFIHTVGQRWWLLADSETKTIWHADYTGIKSGVQVGRNLPGRFAVWVKPELWWGPKDDGQWNLKFGLVWYR
jgi:hypothetical protein